MLTKLFDSLSTLAYPQDCRVCQNSVETLNDGVVCSDCWTKTRIFRGTETLCEKCGRFLSDSASNFLTFCHECDGHFYDQARAVGLYENGLQASIIHLKHTPFVSKRLKKLFIEAFEKLDFTDVDLIIPVPLSTKRLADRGFNQAAVLAKILADNLALKLDENSLLRKTHTPMHRAGMDTRARELTVKNAFEVKRRNLIEGKNILLIDDVFTSGATVSACAQVLKKDSAHKVYVFTLARTF